MDPEIVRLIVGFVLTTVLGGVLGSYLQQRSWKHQNEVRLKEENLKRAGAACESVSRLLDKRLYRMLRLYYVCDGYVQGSFSKEVLEQRLRDYDNVLFEWNDGLNLNLALIGTYFGKSAREYLDFNIYEGFKAAGSNLEQAYRAVSQESHANFPFDELHSQLDQLNNKVYQLGVFMMTQLREGQVGRSSPDPLMPSMLEIIPNVPRHVKGRKK
jgi:hypothetical protein